MDSKNNKINAKEKNALNEKKFFDRFKEKDKPDIPKRALFKFLEVYSKNFWGFLGINIGFSALIIPIIILVYYLKIIMTLQNAKYISNFFPLIILIILLGIPLGGLTSAAISLTKNYHEGKKVFFFSDFSQKFKENFKQSILFGIFDSLGIMTLFIIIPLVYSVNINLVSGLVSFFILFISFVYFSMRIYAYLMISSIVLKMNAIIRNAIFFVVLGIKNNIFSLILNAALIGLSVYISKFSIWTLMAAAMFWIFTGFSLTAYIQTSCAYGKFYEHLIKPEIETIEIETIETDISEKDELDD